MLITTEITKVTEDNFSVSEKRKHELTGAEKKNKNLFSYLKYIISLYIILLYIEFLQEVSMSEIQQLRRGSTRLLILSILAEERRYGYQIMRELEKRSEGYFTMTAALLYPALHQLELDGLVESEWEDGQGKRRRKYYTITSKGRGALSETRTEWQHFMTSLFKALEPLKSKTQE